MKLEVTILFNSENDRQLKDLGIEPGTTIKDCEKREMTFYNVDNISPYREDGEWYCCISSGNQEYITLMSYEEIKKMIEDN